jgi:hypothetical protein
MQSAFRIIPIPHLRLIQPKPEGERKGIALQQAVD